MSEPSFIQTVIRNTENTKRIWNEEVRQMAIQQMSQVKAFIFKFSQTYTNTSCTINLSKYCKNMDEIDMFGTHIIVLLKQEGFTVVQEPASRSITISWSGQDSEPPTKKQNTNKC
jgi:hypothetical protein